MHSITSTVYPLTSIPSTGHLNSSATANTLAGIGGGGVQAHPPIPITELAAHIERLKANDNMLFFQEYEVKCCSRVACRHFTPLAVNRNRPELHMGA